MLKCVVIRKLISLMNRCFQTSIAWNLFCPFICSRYIRQFSVKPLLTVVWFYLFIFLMPDKCQLCFGYIVCSMTINIVIMLELVINIIIVNYDKYSAEPNKWGWEISKLIDLSYLLLFLATSSCRFSAGERVLFTNSWLSFEMVLSYGSRVYFTLRWRGLKYGVVVRRRKELLFCPHWMLWRKMYVLVSILDAYSIEGKKKYHDSSQTKHIATEILVIYFNPLRCGLNYLGDIYLFIDIREICTALDS